MVHQVWMDLYCHCVCPGSYLKYAFSIYKANYDNRIGESSWPWWSYLICIITCGLCPYHAQLFNDDITAIRFSYWRRRAFSNYARLHCGIIAHHALRDCSPIDNKTYSGPFVLGTGMVTHTYNSFRNYHWISLRWLVARLTKENWYSSAESSLSFLGPDHYYGFHRLRITPRWDILHSPIQPVPSSLPHLHDIGMVLL